MPATYSISAAAKASGLSAHTIRAWEKRYGVTSPDRTPSNRRKYNEADILRFKLLKNAVGHGHSIGMIAHLTDSELRNLIGQPENTDSEPSESAFADAHYLQNCIQAMMNLDSPRLESELSHASAVLGVDRFLEEVVMPLLQELDEGWNKQRISIAQEHLASALLRGQLDRIRASIQVPAGAPRILITTPSGQLHEIGALLAAIAAAREGWNVTYLGPNLPAEEIAEAFRQTRSRMIGLSLVYPENDATTPAELRKLRGLLPDSPILVGGRAAPGYLPILADIGAVVIDQNLSLSSALKQY